MTERKMVPMESLIKSISMGPFGSDVKVEYMRDDGVPIIDGSNLTGIKMNWDNYRYLDKERAEKLKSSIAHKGDIVVTHRGTLGQISYVPNDCPFDEFLISQSQFRVTLDTTKVNPVYFAYYFHTSEGQKRLLSFANYVGVPALASATSNFRELEFPLIDLEHQERIANILTSIDEKIENNTSICATLEAMAKLLYDYWFVQFDFPDENGRPYKSSGGKMVWNEELKREIPEGWEVKPVLEVFDWIGTSQPPKSTFKYEPRDGYVRFIQNRDYDTDNHITYIPLTESTRTCNKWDIMMDKYGDAGKIRFGIAGAYNVALSKISVHDNKMREYVRAYLKSDTIYNYLAFCGAQRPLMRLTSAAMRNITAA